MRDIRNVIDKRPGKRKPSLVQTVVQAYLSGKPVGMDEIQEAAAAKWEDGDRSDWLKLSGPVIQCQHCQKEFTQLPTVRTKYVPEHEGCSRGTGQWRRI